MNLPLTRNQTEENNHPTNSNNTPEQAAVSIVVQTDDGPIEVEADVTTSQARRVLAFARSLQLGHEERPHLSPREKQVLSCLSRGLSYKQVAGELDISIDTVRTYVRALYRKLGAHSVTEAICRARELALV